MKTIFWVYSRNLIYHSIKQCFWFQRFRWIYCYLWRFSILLSVKIQLMRLQKKWHEKSVPKGMRSCVSGDNKTHLLPNVSYSLSKVFIWPLHFSQLLSLVLKVSLQAIWKISWKFEEQTLRNTKQNVYLCWNSWWWFFSIQVFHSLYLLTLLLCQLFLLNTVIIWFKTVLNLEPHLL